MAAHFWWSTSVGERDSQRPIMAYISNGYLWVTLQDRRIIATPIEWYPGLSSATRPQLERIELGEYGIYWPDLDGHISTQSMLEGYAPLFRWEDLASDAPGVDEDATDSGVSAQADDGDFSFSINPDDLVDDLGLDTTLASD